MTNPAEKKCFLCSSPTEKGIHLLNGFICLECEKKIVHFSGTEKNYTDYVEKIKQMWREVLSCQISNT